MIRDALALLVILAAAIGWIALLWWLRCEHPAAFWALLCGLLSLAPLIPLYLIVLRKHRRGEL